MAVVPASGTPSILAPSRAKVLLILSLAVTWWFASVLPHYRPAIKEKFKARLGDALQALPTIKIDWGHTPHEAYNASKLALMIEPRPLPHLVPHLLHMMSVVPPDWRFLFVGSEESVMSISRAYATKYQQVIGKLDLMVLPEPWNITSKEQVWRTLTDQRFYEEFLPNVEWLLRFESDAIMCANSKKNLNEWLDWHWIASPRGYNDQTPGQGGLSLRRVSAIRRVLSFQARYNDSEPEDEWFSKRIYLLPNVKVASPADEGLAVEEVYFPNPMGFHVRDGGRGLLGYQVWGDEARRKEIFSYCPELSLIMDMKLERERCYIGSPQANPTFSSWGQGNGWGQSNDEARKAFFESITQPQGDTKTVPEDVKKVDPEGGEVGAAEQGEIGDASVDGSLGGSLDDHTGDSPVETDVDSASAGLPAEIADQP